MVSVLRNLKRFMVVCIVLSVFALPGAAMSAAPAPGDVIDASNVEQYKEYLPMILQGFVKDGWGLEEPVTLHVKDRTGLSVPKSYNDATKNNIGKVTLNEDGTLNGHVIGLPFPDPKEPNMARKVLWNHYYRWRSDGFSYDQGFWTTSRRKGGKISNSLALIDMLFFAHRTSVDPKPDLPNRNGLFYALLLDSQTPPNKDMATLTWRYDDPKKNDDMWTYVPTLRRTLRLMSSERSNPVRGTTYTWDDFYGFDGRILDYTPTLVGEPTLLALMSQQTKAVEGTKFEHGYPHPVVAGPTDPYELHDFVVIDVTPKNKRHPESKKTLFISKESYHAIYSHVYDKQGNLWKGMVNAIINFETAQGEAGWTQCSSALTDLKNGYWGQNLLWEVTADGNMNMERFTPGALGTY